jgi:hypothetical protein
MSGRKMVARVCQECGREFMAKESKARRKAA